MDFSELFDEKQWYIYYSGNSAPIIEDDINYVSYACEDHFAAILNTNDPFDEFDCSVTYYNDICNDKPH